ncbi:hypothetical protein HK102_007386 [Quaeritorhiza haematococci]|nr:hypothetical protein HK102_007386 [Quaeritorhiza haematococci]
MATIKPSSGENQSPNFLALSRTSTVSKKQNPFLPRTTHDISSKLGGKESGGKSSSAGNLSSSPDPSTNSNSPSNMSRDDDSDDGSDEMSRTSSVSSVSSAVNSIDGNSMFGSEDPAELERMIFTAINDGNRDALQTVFRTYPSSTAILQLLLTTTYPNHDGFYKHDPEVLQDAHELLGPSVENLNAIQIASMLGEEEIASDILEFVATVTEEIEARKVLYEFMGRVWGGGNTVLHLASFLGMSDLVKRLLELGATPNKVNERKYKPVDCADDDITRQVFTTVTEVVRPSIHVPEHDKVTAAPDDGLTMRHSRSAEEFLTAPTRQLHSEINRLRSSPNDEGVTGTDKSNNSLKALMEDEEDQGMRHSKARSFDDGCLPVRSSAETPTLKWSQSSKAAPPTVGPGASADPAVSSAKGDTSNSNVGKGFSKDAIDQTGTRKGVGAGLNQEAKFPSSILTKDGASGSPGKKRIPKFLRKVSFDAPTMVLNVCQFGDPVDNVSLPTLKAALGLPMSDSTDEAANGGEAKHVGKENGSAGLGTKTRKIKVDVNMVTTGHQWLTPLHLACSHGHLNTVEVLLREAFSGVNLRDKEGWTPLHCACAEGHLEIIKLLGRCQGRAGEERTPEQLKALGIAVDDWLYPPDGPIDLIPLNADGETPEDVAFDGKADEIGKILADLKKRYPPSERETSEDVPGSDAGEEESSDEEEDDDDDSEEDEEPPAPRKPSAAKTQIKAGAGSAAASAAKPTTSIPTASKSASPSKTDVPSLPKTPSPASKVASAQAISYDSSADTSVSIQSKPSTPAPSTTTKSSTVSETKAEDGTKLSSASHATSLKEKPTAKTGASATQKTASIGVPPKIQASDSLFKAKSGSVPSESAVIVARKSGAEVSKVDADVAHGKSSVSTKKSELSSVGGESKSKTASDAVEVVCAAMDAVSSPEKKVEVNDSMTLSTKTKTELPSRINHDIPAKTTTTPTTHQPSETQSPKTFKSDETSKQDPAESYKATTTSSTSLPTKRDLSEKTVQSIVSTTTPPTTAQSSESAQRSKSPSTIATPSSKSSASPRNGSADELAGKLQDGGNQTLTPQQPEKQSQQPSFSSLPLQPPVSGTRRSSAEELKTKESGKSGISSMATASPQPHSQSTKTHSISESVLPSTKPETASTSKAADMPRKSLANDVDVKVATSFMTTVASNLNETDVQSVSKSELQQSAATATATTTSTTAPEKFAAPRHEDPTVPAISTKSGSPSDVSKKEEPQQTSPRTSTDAKPSTAQHQSSPIQHTSSNQKDGDADRGGGGGEGSVFGRKVSPVLSRRWPPQNSSSTNTSSSSESSSTSRATVASLLQRLSSTDPDKHATTSSATSSSISSLSSQSSLSNQPPQSSAAVELDSHSPPPSGTSSNSSTPNSVRKRTPGSRIQSFISAFNTAAAATSGTSTTTGSGSNNNSPALRRKQTVNDGSGTKTVSSMLDKEQEKNAVAGNSPALEGKKTELHVDLKAVPQTSSTVRRNSTESSTANNVSLSTAALPADNTPATAAPKPEPFLGTHSPTSQSPTRSSKVAPGLSIITSAKTPTSAPLDSPTSPLTPTGMSALSRRDSSRLQKARLTSETVSGDFKWMKSSSGTSLGFAEGSDDNKGDVGIDGGAGSAPASSPLRPGSAGSKMNRISHIWRQSSHTSSPLSPTRGVMAIATPTGGSRRNSLTSSGGAGDAVTMPSAAAQGSNIPRYQRLSHYVHTHHLSQNQLNLVGRSSVNACSEKDRTEGGEDSKNGSGSGLGGRSSSTPSLLGKPSKTAQQPLTRRQTTLVPPSAASLTQPPAPVAHIHRSPSPHTIAPTQRPQPNPDLISRTSTVKERVARLENNQQSGIGSDSSSVSGSADSVESGNSSNGASSNQRNGTR